MNSPRGSSRKTGCIHRLLAILLLIVLPGLARSEDDSAAWSQIGRLAILEAKPGPWQAQWIDAGPGISGDAIGRVFFVRKVVHLPDPSALRRVYVSADSKYKLWINGRPAARGPARFDPDHQQYDTLDLSSLAQAGDNVIAAAIVYWGVGGPIFQMSARPAFVFECPEVKSDATWKTMVSPGQDTAGFPSVDKNLGYMAGNWLERVDARLIPDNWQEPGFDDSAWPPARAILRAETWGEGDTRSPWKLQPRTIPALQENPPVAFEALQSGRVKDTRNEPPFSQEVAPETTRPTLPCTVPADGQIHYLVFSAGKLVTAYPRLEMEGGEGAQVEIMYAEAPSINRKKDRRDVLGDKRVEGYNDIYVTRNGRQAYEPFIHRTFWYVRVAIKTPTPLTIRGFTYRWTSYAFPERGSFACSDEILNKIWQVGWYTARLCAHESYEDCPYYEQLQYVGDTRIQAMLTYYASGDPRLPAAAIRHLNASRLPEGLTYSRYPSHVYQIIPGFSLFWVLMLDDYYLHTGDLKLVRECAGGVYSVLRFFEDHQTDRGFIANVPYWNFHDWNFPPNGEPPAAKENCTLTSLLYKGALDAGTRLFTALGDPEEARRFHLRSQAMAKAINQYAWSEKEGLYTDGIAVKSLSRHVNIYAVLFDVADSQHRERIARRLFTDSSVRDTTFYFAYYLHEAARKLGQPQRIIDDLARWKGMLDQGTSTWWETPGQPRSDCHAWSSAPTFVLMQEVLGVRPVEPGFRRVLIQPFPAQLQWAKGAVPTPHGDIQVDWKRGPVFTLNVTLPPDVDATVILPSGAQRRIGPGAHVLADKR